MHSASQNGNRLRLVDTLSVLQKKMIFQGISAHNTMPGHLSTRASGREGVSLGTVTMAKLLPVSSPLCLQEETEQQMPELCLQQAHGPAEP